jgi:hypothetical protein
MELSKTIELVEQIEKTLRLLETKYQQSNEQVVADYIHDYQGALASLRPESEDIFPDLDVLLNRARGYLETSSHWDQDFLHEMGNTERLIRELG